MSTQKKKKKTKNISGNYVIVNGASPGCIAKKYEKRRIVCQSEFYLAFFSHKYTHIYGMIWLWKWLAIASRLLKPLKRETKQNNVFKIVCLSLRDLYNMYFRWRWHNL